MGGPCLGEQGTPCRLPWGRPTPRPSLRCLSAGLAQLASDSLVHPPGCQVPQGGCLAVSLPQLNQNLSSYRPLPPSLAVGRCRPPDRFPPGTGCLLLSFQATKVNVTKVLCPSDAHPTGLSPSHFLGGKPLQSPGPPSPPGGGQQEE